MMFLQVIILLAGFLFLVKGADWFVEGAASIAKKLGIPQLIIGLTIVAMGTSMPEAAVSITAAINKNAGITIGNVVGSNILNILIILGITAVITNVAIQRSTLLYEIPFMTVITIVLLIFGITGSEVTFIEGVIFWILFLIYLGYLFVMAKKGNDQEEAEAKDTVKQAVQTLQATISHEYQVSDPDVTLKIKECTEAVAQVMNRASGDAIIDALVLLPNGVQKMSDAMPELVQTSLRCLSFFVFLD